MMAEFFDHPETGKLHLRAPAGGLGGGSTSIYEGPASEADIAAFPQAHHQYLAAKREAQAKAAAEAESAAENAALHAENERLHAAVAEAERALTDDESAQPTSERIS